MDLWSRHSQKLTSVWALVSRLAQAPANHGISSRLRSRAAVHRWAQSARWSGPLTSWRLDRQTHPLQPHCGRRCTEMFLQYTCLYEGTDQKWRLSISKTPELWSKSGGSGNVSDPEEGFGQCPALPPHIIISLETCRNLHLQQNSTVIHIIILNKFSCFRLVFCVVLLNFIKKYILLILLLTCVVHLRFSCKLKVLLVV